MSLYKYSFGEVFKAAFTAKVWVKVIPALWQTLYMVLLASVITLLVGIILGILLAVTGTGGLHPVKWFSNTVGAVVNCLRSLPQIIMIIACLPLAKLLLGQTYGENACIIALAASCIPMFGRIVENCFLEIAKGKIEAAKAMGSSNLQIIFRVLLPETLPSLIRGFTLAVIAIISMTALSGSFGAGGLGYLAVQEGFERVRHEVLIATIIVLIAIVTLVQLIGDFVSKLILKRRHLI